MKYSVRLSGSPAREFEVELIERDGVYRVRENGREHVVDLAAVTHGEKYSVLVDGRSYAISVDGDGKKLGLIVDGHRFAAEVEDEREQAARALAGASGQGGGVVESVMPGIVRSVAVAEGDVVKKGQRLLVLEAMKMENEILADGDGVVAKVHVAPGQTVESGAALVSVAPA